MVFYLVVFVYWDLFEYVVVQIVVECLLMNGVNFLLKNYESNIVRNCIVEINKELLKIFLKYESMIILFRFLKIVF